MVDIHAVASEAASIDPIEVGEWLDSLEYIIRSRGSTAASDLLSQVLSRALVRGVLPPIDESAPYVNTIPKADQPPYPGDREMERRIKSIIRWNAMAMVVGANRDAKGIGGHISTFASAATLYEVGFQHFFKGPMSELGADQIYFQGHATPGIYARAFLEGRLTEEALHNFRRELSRGNLGGLSSYPHPRLMPGFWQFPTVSMGLGPIMAVYQARFNRYLEDRGLKDRTGRVWCFVGDGEMDEPEAEGCIGLAGREQLDNLTFVINCNLQRLDGPVRGNGKIIEELDTLFRGAGWEVIKVIWGSDWDPMFENDRGGALIARLAAAVDGDFQKYTVESGAYIREHFFSTPQLKALVAHLTDEEIKKLRKGGHDPEKVYAAYLKAITHKGAPTVVLAHTIKGYGLGEAGEGRNITHQQKNLNEQELKEFRSRFEIPISDDHVGEAPFYKPAENNPEMLYLKERRQALGGFVPARSDDRKSLRYFFEVSAEHIAAAALSGLSNTGKMNADETSSAIAQLGIDPEAPDPFVFDEGGNGRC